jgi:hypothetical protein
MTVKLFEMLQVEVIRTATRRRTGFSGVTPENPVEVVRLLLDNGGDVSAGDNQLLEIAACHGHVETAQLLLDRGANPSECDALTDAVFHGHLEMVKLQNLTKSSGMQFKVIVLR